MLREFRCDFHIHTCLSPCASLDMYPRALVEKCVSERIDAIAVCDHNASENVPYVIRAAQGKTLVVFPGMEITSSEEVHVLALFDNLEGLYEIQERVYGALAGENNEDVFGCQAIVNEQDEVEGFNPRLLIGSTSLSLQEVVSGIHSAGGLAIACHIDRESFGVIGQLGFIPADVRFDALEISHRTGLESARAMFAEFSGYAFIESSDAHRLEDIGRGVTRICMKEASIAELKLAFSRKGNRRVLE
ncbi:MAG: PHP domain-containing protein [Syntrophales bacterium]